MTRVQFSTESPSVAPGQMKKLISSLSQAIKHYTLARGWVLVSDWELLVLLFKGLERRSLGCCDSVSSGNAQARRGTGVAVSSSFPNKGVAWAAERLQGCWCGGAQAECCSLGAGWAEKAVQVSWKDGYTRGFPWVLPQSSPRRAAEEKQTVERNLATSPAFRLLIQRGKMSSVSCGWTLLFVSGSCREQIQARAECLGSYVSQWMVAVRKNGMCDARGGKQRGFPHLCFHVIIISH